MLPVFRNLITEITLSPSEATMIELELIVKLITVYVHYNTEKALLSKINIKAVMIFINFDTYHHYQE